MAKKSSWYKCSNCGNETATWSAKCFNCNSFSTVEEVSNDETASKAQNAGLKSSGAIAPAARARTIKELNAEPNVRTSTGIGELDRVLGGGLVDAEVVLIAGEPGSGKSTLSMRLASNYANMGKSVLYASGEESESQVALRAQRMEVDNELIRIVNESSLEAVLGHMDAENPTLVIVDSLQTLSSIDITGGAGSISQGKEVSHALTRRAKKDNITMFIINQVNKDGEFAGSESIQHIVDCVLFLESDEETPLKFLRARKNRFGETAEVGVFQHSSTGLEEVIDPSGVFMDDSSDTSVEGATVGFISEGVRQIPTEIQALAIDSNLPTPRKQFSGVQFQRGQIVCAILDKFCKTKLYEKDVFISTVSGIKAHDPQADLSIAASLLSSVKSTPFKARSAFVGEITLTGKVRGGFMIEQKIKEAARLGFDSIVVPSSAQKTIGNRKFGIDIKYISSVKELERLLK